MNAGEDRKIYAVSELTKLIRQILERQFDEVWVEGELTNVRKPVSGHCYFTIRDATSQISAVMFRTDQRALGFPLKDGLKIRALGKVSVYEPRGSYQIIVRRMEESGKGALQAAFEELKRKLQAEGLFDTERKRPLPLLPRHIGIVTSVTGAAIRDILKVLSRRYPNMHVVIAPARVQGDGAAGDIAEGISMLNRHGGLDVIIVGRGGGSMEDLWCFNEEIVARAISASGVPVISAVGHEIDFTISDFVADLRAPTPSAAAEMVVNRKEDLEHKIDTIGDRLRTALRQRLLESKARLASVRGSRVFVEPKYIAGRLGQDIAALGMRMKHATGNRTRDYHQGIDDSVMRIERHVREYLRSSRDRVGRFENQLRALNPKAVLVRGYSITMDGDGRVLRSIKNLDKGDRITTHLSDGEFTSDVVSTKVGS